MTETIKRIFKYHVDASLFNFRWADAQYIEVEYCARKDGKEVIVAVTNFLEANPYLIGMIVLHNNWMRLMENVEAAAKDMASKELNPVEPIILNSIAPFAPHITLN
jgi:hypothetical protein